MKSSEKASQHTPSNLGIWLNLKIGFIDDWQTE
jgi:hypothetical protein